MGLIKNIVIVVLCISFSVFVALFGRLPVFRKTPIGFLHRLICIHIPRTLFSLDSRLTGGRISRSLRGMEQYLLYKPHPLVLIFFFLLLSISEILFIPPALPLLPSQVHHLILPLLVTLPYLTLYLCVTTPSTITPNNHATALSTYPYDHTIFHPHQDCRTCHFTKPPRSKHCSICSACIQKHDHHCIWINNCVGRNNYRYFLALLISTSLLLAYGTYLGHAILDSYLQSRLVPSRLTRGSATSKRWSTNLSWSTYMSLWGLAIRTNVRVGAVALLALLSFPLCTGFFGYHLYLVWAGMTTNESAKWDDLREDIADGLVWRARRADVLREIYPSLAQQEFESVGRVEWPVRGKWVVLTTSDGERPRFATRTGNKDVGPGTGVGTEIETRGVENGHASSAPGPTATDQRWERVNSLVEVENVYDLGFWDNLWDVLLNRG